MSEQRKPRGRISTGGRGRSAGGGPPCPADPEHGPLVDWSGKSERYTWMCPHTDHGGRNRNHPLGPSGPTKFLFTDKEAH